MDTLTLLDLILTNPTQLMPDRLIEDDNYENNNINTGNRSQITVF